MGGEIGIFVVRVVVFSATILGAVIASSIVVYVIIVVLLQSHMKGTSLTECKN